MSGLEVIGGISAVSGLLGQAAAVWKSAKKDINLPKPFKETADELFIVQKILQVCHDHLTPTAQSLKPEDITAIRGIISVCRTKAEKIKVIFEKTISGDQDGALDRYGKCFRRFGKSSKIEELLAFIAREAQYLTNYNLVKSNNLEMSKKLQQIVQKLEDAEPSASDEPAGPVFNTSGGTVNANTGSGSQNNTTGNVYGQGGSGNTYNFGTSA